MPGTWLGLETGRRGIMVHQRSLDTTGHNLANASTPGYSRQEVMITATDPFSNPTMDSAVTPGQLGTGSMVNMIRRITDEHLQQNVYRSATDTTYWEDQISILQRAESSFSEPDTDGIDDLLVDFFKAWMDLNNTPQDPGVKAAVVEVGDGLANLMSYTYSQLKEIQNSVVSVDDTPEVVGGIIKEQVDSANDVLTQINDLTEAIKKIYDLGQQPNDLMDKRDALLEQLAEFGPVKVTYGYTGGKPNGELQVSFMGQEVVNSEDPEFQPVTLSLNYNDGGTDDDDTDDTIELVFSDPDGTELKTVDLTNQEDLSDSDNIVSGGSLLGVEAARQQIVGFKDKLNNFAITLRDNIMADSTNYFFQGDLVNGDFNVIPSLINDPSQLDGDKAKNNANVRSSEIEIPPLTKPCTLEEYFGILITEVGGAAKGADDMAATQSAIRDQIAALRDSVSGVSIDEELTKMLQFQYGFQASSRMITTIDSMLDVIINKLF
ncbi:flagellar hook-associated protein FlgK [Desulfocucumis palustris]|uniref:Flagellar hook-associated protein 1 n=1 Tax=Desulfocucumis palustris TaxID=1898651 RepID=A0A2L2XEM8_9FIRM|nr:flagellar hook-associated protein FlgK [Desulfocucumis palustris]GBF32281.1 flagellar hook-associated protein FlgK [Desulfocucumis palustris]